MTRRKVWRTGWGKRWPTVSERDDVLNSLGAGRLQTGLQILSGQAKWDGWPIKSGGRLEGTFRVAAHRRPRVKMTIPVDALDSDYLTFPQFVTEIRQLEAEARRAAAPLPAPVPPPAPAIVVTLARATSDVPAVVVRQTPETYRAVLAVHRALRAHTVEGPEQAGLTYQCRRCGKWFTGGVGAVCVG